MNERGRVGMICLIVAESSLFAVFVVAYLFYIGKSLNGPYPKDVLELPIFNTVCLLSSSITIAVALRALRTGAARRSGVWLLVTIVLGAVFLAGTAREWYRLIVGHGLTIGTNLFGTTFYSLVGLHASHVIVGLAILILLCVFAFSGTLREHPKRAEIASWYWHFVDAVWIVVFTVVYLVADDSDARGRVPDHRDAGADRLATGPRPGNHPDRCRPGDERDRVGA